MARLRILLAFIVMVALPLQGFAAASMLFCGIGAHHASSSSGKQENGSHQHLAAGHAQADPLQHDVAGGASEESLKANAGHTCGICAACSHSVAISETAQEMAFTSLPHAEPSELFVLVHSRPTLVPDKPPRV